MDRQIWTPVKPAFMQQVENPARAEAVAAQIFDVIRKFRNLSRESSRHPFGLGTWPSEGSQETAVSNANTLSPLKLFTVVCAGIVSACASQPLGPTVQVLPAPNKPFEVFQADQATCKQYADQQTAGEADKANQNGVGAAVIGTVLGAGLGAAVGGGRGAGIGAAGGTLVGADVGAGSSSNAQYRIQHQYNLAYSQCMYAKGDQVVGYRPYSPPVYAPPPPPGYYPPPPPPGYAPSPYPQ
jgi:uncharacterized protein YcfJ